MDETVFLKACQDGDLKHISSQIGISDKLDINTVEKVDGNTGLILAVRENREDLVSWLLDNTNVDVNIANKFGYTALMVAAQNGNTDILDSLLRHRTEVNRATANPAPLRCPVCEQPILREGGRASTSDSPDEIDVFQVLKHSDVFKELINSSMLESNSFYKKRGQNFCVNFFSRITWNRV